MLLPPCATQTLTVMEAAARTAVEAISGKSVDEVEYHAVRGIEGIKEAEIKAGDLTVKVCVAHGGSNIKNSAEKWKEQHDKT